MITNASQITSKAMIRLKMMSLSQMSGLTPCEPRARRGQFTHRYHIDMLWNPAIRPCFARHCCIDG
jgi:hypothetical protein